MYVYNRHRLIRPPRTAIFGLVKRLGLINREKFLCRVILETCDISLSYRPAIFLAILSYRDAIFFFPANDDDDFLSLDCLKLKNLLKSSSLEVKGIVI